jgi:predicted nuclease of predicted toxin-antitoxin system
VTWVGHWNTDPGDEEVLAEAHRQGRILVTLDKDFGELAIVHGMPHHGIVRLVGFPARRQGMVCAQVLAHHGQELFMGAVVTAEPGRTLFRPPQAATPED